jgi:hypothetical protein
MNDNEYDWEDTLFEQDVEGAVKQSLQYLLDEGVIVKIGDKYRLKTKREIKKELNDILNHNE